MKSRLFLLRLPRLAPRGTLQPAVASAVENKASPVRIAILGWVTHPQSGALVRYEGECLVRKSDATWRAALRPVGHPSVVVEGIVDVSSDIAAMSKDVAAAIKAYMADLLLTLPAPVERLPKSDPTDTGAAL